MNNGKQIDHLYNPPLIAGVFAFLLAAIVVSSACLATETFTLEHIARLRTVGAAAISPNGKLVAYTLNIPRNPFTEDNGSRWTELHLVNTGGVSRPFVTGKVNVSAVDWTPDGKAISYLAQRNEDEHKSLYIIPVDGGESRRILEHDTGISSYSWSPDSKRVAFLATEKQDKDKKKLKKKGFNQEIYEEELKPVHVWIAEPFDTASKPRMLDLPGSASELHWSPDGEHLALALAPTPLIDDRYMARKLHVVDVTSGKIITSFDNPGKLGKVAFSPTGEYLAVVSAINIHDPKAGHLMVGSVASGELRDLLPDYEGHIRGVAWRSNRTILYLADQGVYTTFAEIGRDGTGQKTLIAPGGAVLWGLSVSRDGQYAAFDGSTATHPWEVYYLKPGTMHDKHIRLTNSNPWLDEIQFAAQEVVEFKARDGLDLQGILIRPLDEKPGKRYPLILSVHGGPESHERNGWKTTYSRLGQVAAANGFAVFYPNYRGSTGRGVEFSKMGQADYAGGEFNDLVDAVHHLVETGLVDKDRVGITGGSYGGYASAWGATALSEHFAASVMSVGVSDLISKFGTTDIPNEMYLVHARSWPWEKWQWYLERSPIYHAQKARTPILILHGKNDTRVHPSQSMELYRYLKTIGKAPVRLVFYPGEGHGNSKAAARYDFSLRKLRWMQHYLQGPGGEPPPYELEYPLGEGLDEDGDEDE